MEKLKATFNEELLKANLEIKEQTFKDISEEIHDNVGQILSLAKVQVNIMYEQQLIDRELLNDLKLNIGQAITDLRNIAQSLHGNRFHLMSLEEGVRAQAEKINKSGFINIEVYSEGVEHLIDDKRKLISFRIIQESLQNVLKHAEAKLVRISLYYLPKEIRITIKDDGKGFDTESPLSNNKGLGLGNIRTRVMLTGGNISISSKINQGTALSFNIPYE